MKIRQLFVTIFFLLPTLQDLLLLYSWYISTRGGYMAISRISTIIIPMLIVSAVIYILVLLYLLGKMFKIKNTFFTKVTTIFETYRFPIMLSVLLSIGTYLSTSMLFFYSTLEKFFGLNSYPTAFLFVKFGLVMMFVVLYKFASLRNIRNVVGLVVLSLTTLLVLYFCLILFFEFRGRIYGGFPLNDEKGRYTINYDGDYWLTYYEVRQECSMQANKEICSEELTKKGNAAISHAPTDLKLFIDKNVRVKGNFEYIHGPIYGENKRFCITGTFYNKSCEVSQGKSYWYFSPLKIKSIELDK